MFTPLIVAAAMLTAAPAIPPLPVPPLEQRGPDVWPLPKQAAPMPNLFHQPSRCGPVGQEITRRIETANAGRVGAEYTVMRQVDGCGVPSPVGYHPDYLAPGAADARPAGAPARRR